MLFRVEQLLRHGGHSSEYWVAMATAGAALWRPQDRCLLTASLADAYKWQRRSPKRRLLPKTAARQVWRERPESPRLDRSPLLARVI